MVEPNLGLLVGVGVDPEGEKGAAPGSMAGNQAPVIWDPRARGKPEASRELGQASRTRNRSGAAALGVAQAATWPQTSRFPPSPPRWTGGTAHLTRAEPGSPGRGAGSLGSALHCRPQHAAAAPGASFASPCPQVYLSLRLLLGLNLFPLDSATHLLLPPPLPSLPLCTLSLPRLRVRSVRRARPNPQGARPSTGPHLAVTNTQVAHPLL